MKKKSYTEAELEVLKFGASDIVTASETESGDSAWGPGDVDGGGWDVN